MIANLFNRLSSRRHSKPNPRPRRTACLTVESLEDRTVPATLTVDPTHFTTIQAAINAAHAGDTIKIAGGTYTEQLHFDGAAKSNITLVPKNNSSVTIKAPATLDPGHQLAVIDISGSCNVNIFDLKIVGNNQSEFGIRVDSNGSAFIRGNTISNILGGGNSAAILVGRNEPGDATVGSATIIDNTISNYAQAGIVVDNFGSYGMLSQNTIIGSGANALQLQYGVQISRGANADVRCNTITMNSLAAGDSESAGVLVWNAGSCTTIDNNRLSKNTDGVFLFQTSGAEVSNNSAYNNTGDGITVVDSWRNEIFLNTTYNNARNGVALYGGDPYEADLGTYAIEVPVGGNNDVFLNCAHDNDENGFLLDFQYTVEPDGVAGNNALIFNSASDNGENGFLLITANQNLIWNNYANHNGASGIAATASSTNNQIISNEADYNVVYGISFLQYSSDNLVMRNSAERNGNFGFFQDGSSDNTFVCNVSFGNGFKGKMNFSNNISQEACNSCFRDFTDDWGHFDSDCDLDNWNGWHDDDCD